MRSQVEKSAAAPGQDLFEAVREAFAVYFEMAERNPHFVKIYIREYYSDDRRVRRVIREHNESTIRNISEVLGRLNAKTGLEIDTDLGGILIGSFTISLINYYLGFPARRRRALRDRMITGLVELLIGGMQAVRPEAQPSDPPSRQPGR